MGKWGIDGGAGNDTLYGGGSSGWKAGNDTYIFGKGYEVDTILDIDTTEGNLDVVNMKEDVLPSEVTVKRNRNGLELSIEGTTDKLIIKNYFSPYYGNSG